DAQEILSEVAEVEANLSDLESEQRGYVITGNERLLEEWNVRESEVRKHVGKLRKLVAQNLHQQPRIHQFATLVSERVSWANQTIEARRERGFSAAQEMVASADDVRLLAPSHQLITEIEEEEGARLHQRQTEADIASRT